MTVGVLPDCPDEVLLAELAVVVSSGWDLPARPERASRIRHLLLLADPDSARQFRRAAHQLLLMLDDALREAPDELLGDDDRLGCRILLGLEPAYRAVHAPGPRREAASQYLVGAWHDARLKDPAGSFQRRHQTAALRQVLLCLRTRYGTDEASGAEYDLVSVRRWYRVGPGRQITQCGEMAEYRSRRDGLNLIQLLEAANDPEGLLAEELAIVAPGSGLAASIESVEASESQPGFRRINVRLGQAYDVGEIFSVAWQERLRYGADAPDWGRRWVTVAGLNDGFALEMTVTFTDAAEVPDACWWFSEEPYTDLNEVGPVTLEQIAEVGHDTTITHVWSPSVTERRRQYGWSWVWLDDDDARARWATARDRLETVAD